MPVDFSDFLTLGQLIGWCIVNERSFSSCLNVSFEEQSSNCSKISSYSVEITCHVLMAIGCKDRFSEIVDFCKN